MNREVASVDGSDSLFSIVFGNSVLAYTMYVINRQ